MNATPIAPHARIAPLVAGRRYSFQLRSGRVWCGTVCCTTDSLVVLTGAVELTSLRSTPRRAFFVADVVSRGELVQ